MYEANSDLRDAECVPLKETIHAFFLKEVKPHLEAAWIDLTSAKIGYEVNFNKHFYKHKPLRDLDEVGLEIIELEKRTEGILTTILGTSVIEEIGVTSA